jgi:TP901 family phage tail tape measure protein
MAEVRIDIVADDKASPKFAAIEKAGTSAFDKLRSKAHSALEAIRKNWLAVGAAITAAYMAIKKFISTFASFEERMAEVSTLVDTSTVNMQGLTNAVLSLSMKAPQSAEELARALYQIISAGVDASEAMIVLEASSKAAVAGLSDVMIAADVGTTILNAYGMQVQEINRVFDVLFMGIKLGKTTFAELASTLGRVVTMAATAKISFEEVIAAITQMTKVGLSTDEAVTSLRQAIVSLVSPTDQARKAMKELGIQYTDFMDTLKQLKRASLTSEDWKRIIPEIRAMVGLQALVANYEELEEILKRTKNATGAMEEAHVKMAESVSNKLRTFGNILKAVVIKSVLALYGALQWLAAGALQAWGYIAKLNQGLAWLAAKLPGLKYLTGVTKDEFKEWGERAEAAFAAAEEMAGKAADTFHTLTASIEETANANKILEKAQNKVAKQFQDAMQVAQELSAAYRTHYSTLQSLHATAIEQMKAKSQELLRIEQSIRATRMSTEDMILSIRQKSMSAWERYYTSIEALEKKYDMAMKLSGEEKISLLKEIQRAWVGLSDEVREGNEVVVSGFVAQSRAIEAIKKIGEEIVKEQQKKVPELQKEIEVWEKVKAGAASALEEIRKQITDLPLEQTLKLDAQQALSKLREVKEALDALKDKTITVTVEHYGKGSSTLPLTEKLQEISKMYEKSIPTGVTFTADFSQLTSLISLYKDLISQILPFRVAAAATTIPELHSAYRQQAMVIEQSFARPIKLLESIFERFLKAFEIKGSYQLGTSYVPRTGLYMLHRGEMVIPARAHTYETKNYNSRYQITYAPVFNINNAKSPEEIASEIDRVLARMAQYHRSEFAKWVK